MKSRTVEELLLELELTEEEGAQHAELIRECLGRERGLVDDRKKSKEGLKAIDAHLNNISRVILVIHESFLQINDRLAEALLQNFPDSKMPRA